MSLAVPMEAVLKRRRTLHKTGHGRREEMKECQERKDGEKTRGGRERERKDEGMSVGRTDK